MMCGYLDCTHALSTLMHRHGIPHSGLHAKMIWLSGIDMRSWFASGSRMRMFEKSRRGSASSVGRKIHSPS